LRRSDAGSIPAASTISKNSKGIEPRGGTVLVHLPPGFAERGPLPVLLDYAPCTSGADVQLWKLTGAGHGWPGARPDAPPLR